MKGKLGVEGKGRI